MGDRNSDNLQRRMNREGKGLFEIMLESERAPAQEPVQPYETQVVSQATGGTDAAFMEAERPALERHAPFIPDLEPARQRVDSLEGQGSELDRAVQSAASALEETRQLIAEQEKQLKALRDAAREQQKQLLQKQDEQRHNQTQLEGARTKLQSLERQRELAEAQEQARKQLQAQQAQQYQNTYQQNAYLNEQINPEQAAAELAGQITHAGNPAPENPIPQRAPSSGTSPQRSVQQRPAQQRHSILSRHRDTAVNVQARAMPLPGDYQPPVWCFQKLLQNDGIPHDYALKQLEDFKMYWLSTGEARKAWDYRFVKHVIYQWRREHSEGRTNSPRSTEEKLTDRSWASGPLLDFDE